MVEGETDTIMRCLSTPEMTLMEATAPERNGAARRNPSGTIPETPGSAMGVARRAISKGIVNPEEPEEAELENPESVRIATNPAIRRLIAGRSIQKRPLSGSNRRTRRWQGLFWMERQLSLASLIPSPWKQSRRKKSYNLMKVTLKANPNAIACPD